MDLAQLRTFIAAAETGSFAAAAEAVHASPSSVTERIAALEARLSASLFIRSRKGCVLTDAGARFLPRAQAMVAIWEMSRAEARVPARYTQQLRLGGQYALWPDFLSPWIDRLQAEMPQLALSLTAGSSARLNRDLGGEVLDLAVLYSPVLGQAVEARAVLNDRLVPVRAAGCVDWRGAWIDIDWGEDLRQPIAEAVGDVEHGGLRLDIGAMALGWLTDRKAAGYLPYRLANRALMQGELVEIPGHASFDYPAYAIWRRRSDYEVEPVLAALEAYIASRETLMGVV